QHLERPLHDERRVRMNDWPKAGQSKTCGKADHELLADSDVDDAIRIGPRSARQPADADAREHDGDPLVGHDEVVRGRIEAVAHRHGHVFDPTTAMTACGRPSCSSLNARSSSAWSRPSTVVLDQPSSANRAAIPPGHPYDDERLSTATTARFSTPARPAKAIAS